MAKIIIPSKDMVYSSASKSPAMKKLLSNPRIAKALSLPKQRKQFYGEMKKYKSGGVTKDEMRQVLGEIRSNPNDSITREKTGIIAKEIIKSGKRYIVPDKSEVIEKETNILTRKDKLIAGREQPEKKSEPKKDITNRYQLNETSANLNPDHQISEGNRPKIRKRNIYEVLSERRNRTNLQEK